MDILLSLLVLLVCARASGEHAARIHLGLSCFSVAVTLMAPFGLRLVLRRATANEAGPLRANAETGTEGLNGGT